MAQPVNNLVYVQINGALILFFWGGGGPDVVCRIFKMVLSHVSVASKIDLSLVASQE